MPHNSFVDWNDVCPGWQVDSQSAKEGDDQNTKEKGKSAFYPSEVVSISLSLSSSKPHTDIDVKQCNLVNALNQFIINRLFVLLPRS